MLRRIGALPDISAGIRWEGLVSRVASILFNEPVCAELIVGQSQDVGEVPAISLSFGPGQVVALGFEANVMESSRLARGMARLARAILAGGKSNPWKIRPKIGLQAPSAEVSCFSFCLYLSSKKLRANLWACEWCEMFGVAGSGSTANVEIPLRGVLFEAQLSGCVEALASVTPKLYFEIGDSERVRLTLCESASTVRLLVVEDCMPMEASKTAVTLDLGAIEMSLEDLINLRPGCIIEFEQPPELEITLRVGLSTVAKGVARIEKSDIRLKITSIFPAATKLPPVGRDSKEATLAVSSYF